VTHFPTDAPKGKVIKAFELLGFSLVREREHIALIRENADGTRTPLTLPNHSKIKGCAGYLAHPFSKETVYTLACRRCDPSFPVFFPGSRSLQEGLGCPGVTGLHLLCYCVSVWRCSPVLVTQLSISVPEPGRKHHASLSQRWYS